MTDNRSSQNISQTLARGLKVLSAFTDVPVRSLSDICAATGLSRQIAQRLVNTLMVEGYLTRASGSRRYQLDLETIYLSTSARQASLPRVHALPLMIDIARNTGETVNLNLLDRRRWMALCVESVDGTEKTRYNMRLGLAGHLHAGASRKVILAYMTAEERSAAFEMHGRPRLTSATTTDEERLDEELEKIQGQGWAVTTGESQTGFVGCAAPLFTPGSKTILGSLSVIGSPARLDQPRQQAIVEQLLDAAAAVERALPNEPREG